jgi:F420-non-reducing hydrogenase small subunit
VPDQTKPKFAMYWAAGCGGCEIAVLNIAEKILDLDANFEVVFWPVAMDAKVEDVEALPDHSISICLFNGSIRNEDNEAMANLLRQKSQILVAFGSCASEGGIPGLANLYSTPAMVDLIYQTPTTENPTHQIPRSKTLLDENELTLPLLNRRVKTLDQVVPVDYSVPGCPPESDQIATVLDLVIRALHGEINLPDQGSVLGSGASTVCDECSRLRTQKSIHQFKRMATFQPNPVDCLLEQGILCSGIATRSGCKARCPSANMPCIGCYGPASGALDQGARMLSAIGSVLEGKTEGEINLELEGVVDPAGTFYRFGLPNSLLNGARQERVNHK